MMSTIERKNSIGDFRKRQNSRNTEKESETLIKITTKVRKYFSGKCDMSALLMPGG